MPNYLLVLSDPSTGKTQQVEVKDPSARAILGLKIGDELDSSLIGFQGKIKITGGSDIAGIPMRPDVMGPGKRYVLLSGPPGYHPLSYGMRRRKLVRGNTITEDIRQINAVVVERKEEAKKEAPREEKPKPPAKAEKKPEPKQERPEVKKEPEKEARPKQEAKEQVKEEAKESKPTKLRAPRKAPKKKAGRSE